MQRKGTLTPTAIKPEYTVQDQPNPIWSIKIPPTVGPVRALK